MRWVGTMGNASAVIPCAGWAPWACFVNVTSRVGSPIRTGAPTCATLKVGRRPLRLCPSIPSPLCPHAVPPAPTSHVHVMPCACHAMCMPSHVHVIPCACHPMCMSCYAHVMPAPQVSQEASPRHTSVCAHMWRKRAQCPASLRTTSRARCPREERNVPHPPPALAVLVSLLALMCRCPAFKAVPVPLLHSLPDKLLPPCKLVLMSKCLPTKQCPVVTPAPLRVQAPR